MKTFDHVKLEQLMATRLGSISPSEFPAEEFDLYSIPAFDRGKPEIRRGNEIGSAKQIVAPGDVLLSKIVPHIRRSWIVGKNHGKRIIASGEWIVFRGDSFHPDYLKYVLTSNTFHCRFMETVAGVGGSLLRARPSQVAEITIPLPPLPEQRRIAAILDKADAIRRKREEGIRLTEELLRSTFLEMFGDPATNPKAWEVRPFGELAKNEDGRRKPVKEADRAERHGEYPYYGASGIIDYVDEFLFNERTLLIAEDGANLLARSTPIAFIAEGKYWVNNHAHVVSDNGKADLDYLRFSLNLRKLNDFVTGSAQPKLNQASLNRIPIPLPPLPAQQKFADSVRKLNELRDRRQSAANETTSLFGSLVQRAFRGEL